MRLIWSHKERTAAAMEVVTTNKSIMNS